MSTVLFAHAPPVAPAHEPRVSLVPLAPAAEKRTEMDLVCDAFFMGTIRK